MGEISAASSEQSQGVAQVGEAVTNMDQATQQNAALVEEMAAAAGSLKKQAQELVRAVAVFKLGQGADNSAAHQPSVSATHSPTAAPSRKVTAAAAVVKAQPALPAATVQSTTPAAGKSAAAGDDWEAF
jgi:methyl-accepting chemotaxis protein